MKTRLFLISTTGALLCTVALATVVGQGRGQDAGAQAQAAPPAEPTPRWPDGRVNLGSTADKKGYWEIRPGLGGLPRAADVQMQPWARALSEYRAAHPELYPPLVGCKAAGGPGFFNAPGFEIVDGETHGRILSISVRARHSASVAVTRRHLRADQVNLATRQASSRATGSARALHA